MIFLYADAFYRSGGIETYLYTLSHQLLIEAIPFQVCVAELEACPLIDELINQGVRVYRQCRIPGDRWRARQRMLLAWLATQLQAGDWVYCVRWPVPCLYLKMVRLVHRRRAKLAVSWALAPKFYTPENLQFYQAVSETDAVISVSRCTVDQFKQVYNYQGRVHVVPYHNQILFDQVVPLPPAPPWKIGFMGRLDIQQKNLDGLLQAFASIILTWPSAELHFYGQGKDQTSLEAIAQSLGLRDRIIFHGAYDHRRDLPTIMANCHFFVYPSRYEGGPCFTLLELMQAGRFCIAANVGGIPDLYAGYPEAGFMVQPDDHDGLSQALKQTLERFARGEMDGRRVRDRYFDGFDMEAAHQAWKLALNLDG